MKLLALNCNRCGAPLEVPQKAKFLTCTFCGTQLSVQRSGGAAYTEALEELGERTEKLVDDVEVLKLQGELDRLDREWTKHREQYMVRSEEGVMVVPNQSNARLGKVILVVFGVIFTLVSSFMALSVTLVGGFFGLLFMIFPFFGVGFIVLGVVTSNRHSKKAVEFEEARRAYEDERRELALRLDEISG